MGESVTPHLGGLSLRDLEYAVALDEVRHFRRAAERCGVSQPGLSEQIRKLETALGTPLFERRRGGISPTAAGELLLRQIRAVLREARGLMEMARARTDALGGTLDVGVIPTLGPYYVPLVLAPLRQRFPSLVLRLQEGQTRVLETAVAEGGLDAALIALPSADGFSAIPLFFEPFRVLLPSTHPLAADSPISTDALADEDLLLLEEGHCLRGQSLSLCHVPSGAVTRAATSLEMLRHMVAAGEGFCLMPALAAREQDDMGGLVSVRTLEEAGGEPAGRTIGLIWRRTDPRADAFERFGAVLREILPPGLRAAG